MHRTVQQPEQVMQMLTMIMHFHSAVTESPGAIFTEISQWRCCYVTAAVDPAVHITNASHCDGVTCFIQATSRRQQQQCSSCYYSLASVTQDHAEPCSSHTDTVHPPLSSHVHVAANCVTTQGYKLSVAQCDNHFYIDQLQTGLANYS